MLRPMQRALVPTGLVLQLEPGFEAQVRPRSGLAIKHGITVLNTPGTIDADYRGEVQVILVNLGRRTFHRHARHADRPDGGGAGHRGDGGRGRFRGRDVPCRRRFRFHRPLARPHMNFLSRRSLLAIAAVTDIALHARPQPVSAKALAARHKLPARHLEPVLQALVRHGILKGTRGPRGGYELARERRRLTAGDIVRAAMMAETEDIALPPPELAARRGDRRPSGRPGHGGISGGTRWCYGGRPLHPCAAAGAVTDQSNMDFTI